MTAEHGTRRRLSPRRWLRRLFVRPSLARISRLTHALSSAARLGRPLAEACRETPGQPLIDGRALLVLLHPPIGLAMHRARQRELSRAFLSELAGELSTGRRVADVLDDFPEVFPDGYRALVRAGEDGGRLAEALSVADRWCARELQLVADRKTRAIYPVAVMSVLAIIVFLLLFKVLPTLTALAAHAPSGPPAITRLFLAVASGAGNLAIPLAVSGAALVIAFRLATSSAGPLRELRDRLALAAGAGGRSRCLVERAIAYHATSDGLRAGAPLTDAFGSASRVFSNGILRRRFSELSEGLLRDGRSFVFPTAPPLDPLHAAALAVGVRADRLPETLSLLAERSFERARHRDRMAAALSEPALVLATGAFVSLAVIGAYALILWLPVNVIP